MNFLFFLSFFYCAVSSFRNWLYSLKILKAKKAPLPVISIGNITFGGSGKTPLVMSILSLLIEKDYKPALLTRGYKGNWEKKGGILSDGNNILGNWQDSGDEPFMIAKNIPKAGIFVGRNRLSSAQTAAKLGFNLALLDDGFQYRPLARDLDIVLYDLCSKLPLREFPSSLKRADYLLVEKKQKKKIKKGKKIYLIAKALFEYEVKSQGFFEVGKDGIMVSPAKIKSKKALAFCAIARPQRFLSLLHKQGIYPLNLLKFPDHHLYPSSSLEKILKTLKKTQAEILITTEKDAVKVADRLIQRQIPSFYLKIKLQVENKFYSHLLSFLAAHNYCD